MISHKDGLVRPKSPFINSKICKPASIQMSTISNFSVIKNKINIKNNSMQKENQNLKPFELLSYKPFLLYILMVYESLVSVE